MEHAKVIRGKTLGAWKKYAEENYSNTPPQVLKYIIVLEEELSKLSQHDVIRRSEHLKAFDDLLDYAWNLAQFNEQYEKLNEIKERFNDL